MGILGAIWGFSGVSALLGYAIWRLAPRAAESLQSPLTWLHWTFLVVFAIFMLVAEGYRGFQKKFSPRTAARIRHLRDHPAPLHVLLAPAFCMGYFHAKRRTRITAISLTLGIVLLVMLVSYLPKPWRGLVDFGVVLGLAYGMATLAVYTFLALARREFAHSPETP
jgi:hypothetical protein